MTSKPSKERREAALRLMTSLIGRIPQDSLDTCRLAEMANFAAYAADKLQEALTDHAISTSMPRAQLDAEVMNLLAEAAVINPFGSTQNARVRDEAARLYNKYHRKSAKRVTRRAQAKRDKASKALRFPGGAG